MRTAIPVLPRQFWLNLFLDDAGGAHCEAVHPCEDAAIQEVDAWREGMAWRGFRYCRTVFGIEDLGGARRLGLKDLEDVLIAREGR